MINIPTTRVRKSGNSIVLTVPPHYVKERNIKIGQEVTFEIISKVDLSKLWGAGKHLKMDAQKAKDELRKEWGRSDAKLSRIFDKQNR